MPAGKEKHVTLTDIAAAAVGISGRELRRRRRPGTAVPLRRAEYRRETRHSAAGLRLEFPG